MDGKARLIFDRLMRAPLDPEESAKRLMASGELDMNPFRRIEELSPKLRDSHAAKNSTRTSQPTRKADFAAVSTGTGISIATCASIRNRDRRTARRFRPDDHRAVGRGAAAAYGRRDAELCSDLEMPNIDRAGHWVQQEFPEEVNRTIVDWLNRRFKKADDSSDPAFWIGGALHAGILYVAGR